MDTPIQTFMAIKGLNFEGYSVPIHTQGIISRYFFNRLLPGSFGEAVLAGNLEAARWRADVDNQISLEEIDRWIKDNLPEECHGSYDKVHKWCGAA